MSRGKAEVPLPNARTVHVPVNREGFTLPEWCELLDIAEGRWGDIDPGPEEPSGARCRQVLHVDVEQPVEEGLPKGGMRCFGLVCTERGEHDRHVARGAPQDVFAVWRA